MSLPRNLRQDLELIESAPFEDGSPRWRLHDPVANRFYDLGWLEVEIGNRRQGLVVRTRWEGERGHTGADWFRIAPTKERPPSE